MSLNRAPDITRSTGDRSNDAQRSRGRQSACSIHWVTRFARILCPRWYAKEFPRATSSLRTSWPWWLAFRLSGPSASSRYVTYIGHCELLATLVIERNTESGENLAWWKTSCLSQQEIKLSLTKTTRTRYGLTLTMTFQSWHHPSKFQSIRPW